MKKTAWLWPTLAAAVVLALLAACGAAEPPQAAVVTAPEAAPAREPAQQIAVAAGPTLGSQRHGDVQVWLSSSPARPVRGAAGIDAYVVGSDGQPVTGARVTFDIDMTNMSHGPYLVEAEPAGNGHYAGNVRFSMPGPWRVIAVVERPGRETARVRFEFTVNSR